MKTFLRQAGVFLAIQLAMAGGIVALYAAKYPARMNYLAATVDKQQLLATQASPRLILVGGSSMAFGPDSAKLAAACGRQPVNMGLHGSAGLMLMLAEVEPHLRAGDWVVLSPEYEQFANPWGDSDMVANLVEIAPAKWRLLRAQHVKRLLDSGIQQRAGKVARVILGQPGRWFAPPGSEMRKKPFYRRDGFNPNGDMIAHWNVKAEGPGKHHVTFTYREEPVSETLAELRQFIVAARRRGATVFFSHPPIPEAEMTVKRAELLRLEQALGQLDIPRLDTLEETVFPPTMFFDTVYHLAAPGTERRTQLLAEKLKQEYKRTK
jgi:hypothetical protein